MFLFHWLIFSNCSLNGHSFISNGHQHTDDEFRASGMAGIVRPRRPLKMEAGVCFLSRLGWWGQVWNDPDQFIYLLRLSTEFDLDFARVWLRQMLDPVAPVTLTQTAWSTIRFLPSPTHKTSAISSWLKLDCLTEFENNKNCLICVSSVFDGMNSVFSHFFF